MDNNYTVEMFRDEIMMNLKVIDIRLANLKEEVKNTGKVVHRLANELKKCHNDYPDQNEKYA